MEDPETSCPGTKGELFWLHGTLDIMLCVLWCTVRTDGANSDGANCSVVILPWSYLYPCEPLHTRM